ncbi:MAG: sigma-70 family RNA polymerase sigma factor [Deltaproteobacteria bacterium]|nr:sigma-70 family RNA polymerase sigma factor [Deltaproteobacteria bacterium]
MINSELKSADDQSLVAKYLQGDIQAFECLFERHQNATLLLIRQYFPQKEKAEEIFQEVFMKLIEKIKKFENQGSFKAWFLTLCRNHCIDRIRYYQRRPEHVDSSLSKDEDSTKSFIETTASHDATAEESSSRKQISKHLQEALNELPPEQKESLLLKESHGLTFEEISTVMNVSINTAKSRVRYALQALRRNLKNKAFFKELNS